MRVLDRMASEINAVQQLLVNIKNGFAWTKKFNELKSRRARSEELESHLFELKIIKFLIEEGCTQIEYEPRPVVGNKNVDLYFQHAEHAFLLEAKSFRPTAKRKSIRPERLQKNCLYIADGNTSHEDLSVYAHLLEEIADSEDKFEAYGDGPHKILAVREDYHMAADMLEEVTFLYRRGQPRRDDPFGIMAVHFLKENKISFKHAIDYFWSMPFEQIGFDFDKGKLPMCIPRRWNCKKSQEEQ